jgi:hypothetical protein
LIESGLLVADYFPETGKTYKVNVNFTFDPFLTFDQRIKRGHILAKANLHLNVKGLLLNGLSIFGICFDINGKNNLDLVS